MVHQGGVMVGGCGLRIHGGVILDKGVGGTKAWRRLWGLRCIMVA